VDPSEEKTVAALDNYLQDVQAGRASSREKLLAEHPQLADALQCLDDLHELAARDEDDVATIAHPGAKRETPVPALPSFGKYAVEGEIGRGGMGVVFRARQTDLDRPVALKMILTGQLASPEQLARFGDEARFAARLQHPNIVSIYEVGEFLGQPYFAMQYIGGPSLARKLQQGRLAPEEAAHLVCAIAQAVEHLHQHGVIHRDLKPSNILLDEDGRPYVTDFGLVKLMGGDSHKTSSGVIVGTPSYMAPEQAASGKSRTVGPRSDVYSLGAILYEALTGQPPFREATPLDTLVQVLESEPTPPRQLQGAVPADLERICLRCLEKEPEYRYASAAALAQDLQRFLKGETIEAKPATLGQQFQRWARREPALVAHLATLGVCAAIAQLTYQLTHAVSLGFHTSIMAILVAWALVSFACQTAMRRPPWAEPMRFAWIWLDVVFFSLILYLDEAFASPLVIGYPLLIAASGLWFRDALVWFTTVMAILSFGVLLVLNWQEVQDVHKHIMFLVSLAATGFIVTYQVHRVRTLSRYYERRSLP
jgi:eukaryotic-like serine/threonine-protein kinase